MNEIHLSFCVDDTFSPHLGVLITSIVKNHSGCSPIHFHVIGDLSSGNKTKLKACVPSMHSLSTYNVDVSVFDNISISESFFQRLSIATYYRFLIPYLLPDSVKKVVYLDADMVCFGDIQTLYDYDLGEKVSAVVSESILYQKKLWLELNLRMQDYFSAGLMVIDLEKWRKEDISARCFKLAEREEPWTYNDQDILNVVLDGKVVWLEKAWNFQSYDAERYGAEANVSIVHYTGSEKPWHYSSEHLFTQEYLAYKKLSPFQSEPLIHYLDDQDKSILAKLEALESSRVLIYGAGHKGRRIYSAILDQCPHIDVIGFVDRARKENVKDIPVYSSINSKKFDILLIASLAYRQEIFEQVCLQGIEQEKVI